MVVFWKPKDQVKKCFFQLHDFESRNIEKMVVSLFLSIENHAC